MTIKIIIADDHQIMIDGIASILDSEIGIEILGVASNGLELVQMLDKGMRPDVILTDIRMPIMDGISATKVLHQAHPKIPILALSMYEQAQDVQEMIDAGAQGYIIKNAGKQEMIDAIYALHSGHEYFSKDLPISHSPKVNQKNKAKQNLTRREKEIISLIMRDRTSLQIAAELHISKHTVDTHRKNIHKKLSIQTTGGLIRYGLENLTE